MISNIQQHVVRRRTRSQRGSISQSTMTTGVGIVALVLVAALGFFYLQQVLSTASQGTDIADLETQLVEIKQRQRELELEGARLRSLQTVENHVQRLNLTTSNQITYLTPPASSEVAIAR